MPIGLGAMQSTAMGQLGADLIEDTESHLGDWGIIYCLASCTFTTLSPGLGPDGAALVTGTLENITLSPGMLLYGRFSEIRLGSGKVMAYRV